MMATHVKLKRHNEGVQDQDQWLGGNTGESCTLDAMPGIDDSFLRDWVGNGRQNVGVYAAENIKESAMQDASAWIVPLSLVMTVAFAEVLNLPEHIASETPDGFRGEHEFRRVCVVLYALCFLSAGFNVMRLVMRMTIGLITLAQTPAYLTAKLLRDRTHKKHQGTTLFDSCFEKLMRLFCITIHPGSSFVEPNLFLMGIGYSIGLYLTQGWEVAVPSLVLVCAVYPSMRDTVQHAFDERYGSGGPFDYAKVKLSELERELDKRPDLKV